MGVWGSKRVQVNVEPGLGHRPGETQVRSS